MWLFAFVVGLLGIVICACCRIYCSESLFAFAVGLVGWCRCLRLLSDWLGGVFVCACCWIGWVVSLFALVGLVGGAGVSAVGTTLLQSPGWRECQRHEQNPG